MFRADADRSKVMREQFPKLVAELDLRIPPELRSQLPGLKMGEPLDRERSYIDFEYHQALRHPILAQALLVAVENHGLPDAINHNDQLCSPWSQALEREIVQLLAAIDLESEGGQSMAGFAPNYDLKALVRIARKFIESDQISNSGAKKPIVLYRLDLCEALGSDARYRAFMKMAQEGELIGG